MKRFMLAVAMASAFAAPMPVRAAETRSEYIRKAHIALDDLSLKIDAMELKAKEAGTSAREGMDEKLESLKARRKTARKDLAKLKRASGKAWSKLKAGVDRGIQDLKTAYDEAAKD